MSYKERLGLLTIGCALGLLSACGSSADEATSEIAEVASEDAVSSEEVSTEEVSTEEVSTEEVSTEEVSTEEEYVVDDCDYDTFVYTEFVEVPADWPASYPRPEGLVEVSGDVGFGCERQTVDMRSRYYGSDGRDWITAYGEALEAAGFELADDNDQYDELLQWNRTYRRGQDWISYGGNFELVGGDGEYVSLGVSLTDFPD